MSAREPVAGVEALLLEILGELRAIRAAIAPGPHAPLEPGAEALVLAISAHAGDLLFCARELVEHSRLRAAIVAAVGELNSRRLGRLLRRLEGREIAGVRIERVGEDRDGVAWRVSRVSDARKPAQK